MHLIIQHLFLVIVYTSFKCGSVYTAALASSNAGVVQKYQANYGRQHWQYDHGLLRVRDLAALRGI
jgi:hypothetical protein